MPRGKILRDTSMGSGLITVTGQQYPFALENVWKSDVPPATGMSVEVEFDAAGEILELRSIPDSQIAKEQAELALASARDKGGKLAAAAVARFGLPTLAAVGVLFLGWFSFSALSIQTPLGRLDYTFWQLLGLLNSSSPLERVLQGAQGTTNSGIYGLLAVGALLGPFMPYVWKGRRAALGGCLPLCFMVIVGWLLRNSVSSLTNVGGSGEFLQEMAQRASQELMRAISLGVGTYIAIAASIYLAVTAIKKALVHQA